MNQVIKIDGDFVICDVYSDTVFLPEDLSGRVISEIRSTSEYGTIILELKEERRTE